MNPWDCTYSDELREEILQISNKAQRKYFLQVFERMGNYVQEHDDAYGMTFQEFMDLFE